MFQHVWRIIHVVDRFGGIYLVGRRNAAAAVTGGQDMNAVKNSPRADRWILLTIPPGLEFDADGQLERDPRRIGRRDD